MALRTEPFIVNIGPQHPSTHGVFRMITTLDGEVIVDLEPVMGYLHRGVEKLAEERTYVQSIPFTDRLDYLSGMSNNLPYVMAIEKLADIKVPERAEYIRVIMAELQRLANHLAAVGFFANDMGCSATPLVYMFRERERILDLFEMTCGQRLTVNYMRPGGVSQDLPEEFIPIARQLVADMPAHIEEYERLLVENEILVARTKGVGILTREMAINSSASGPVLRASGVNWDLRKDNPYSIYDRFQFNVVTGTGCDVWERYRVRVGEMWQCLRIIDQALKDIPAGPIKADVPRLIRPPVGEAYVAVESPKGELGFYLISDGSVAPYRFKIRSPSFINLTCLREMVVGWKVADAIV
ncbi:MAG: NADH-quinone oxidoreductase subunit D, partial [Dehalococcoidia bacterium]|nr:NADH-quinone oxidoreductase subunit D [Dehalococcoidia bacterium]